MVLITTFISLFTTIMTKKIIVIEDDNDILDLMQYILEDEGYQVIPSNRVEPLSTIIDHQPNLILLDDRLRNGFGRTLCAEIKSRPDTVHIPVVLVSATRDLAKVALDSKADCYLAKPFDISDLISMVKQYA